MTSSVGLKKRIVSRRCSERKDTLGSSWPSRFSTATSCTGRLEQGYLVSCGITWEDGGSLGTLSYASQEPMEAATRPSKLSRTNTKTRRTMTEQSTESMQLRSGQSKHIQVSSQVPVSVFVQLQVCRDKKEVVMLSLWKTAKKWLKRPVRRASKLRRTRKGAAKNDGRRSGR